MPKIISWRANEQQENKIKDLIKVFQEYNKGIKITQSTIISIAVEQLWENNCLHNMKFNKTTGENYNSRTPVHIATTKGGEI